LDRPVVVVEEPTYRGSFSYRPDDKDIEELLKVLDGPKPKKRNAKRKKIIRLEKAAIKILSEGISNPIEPAIIETLKRTDFAIKLLEAKPERRQEQAEELLQQASVLVQEIDKEEEDLLELLLLAA
jgi:hypothetical protein